MSEHTLAVIIIAVWIFQVGFAFATPHDPRPWTSERKASAFVAFVSVTFIIWLLVDVLS